MQKPKKFMAVSCSHGHLINKDAAERVLKFRDEYKPDHVMHLGDFIDADCFRAGAMRNGEGSDIVADLLYGLEFVEIVGGEKDIGDSNQKQDCRGRYRSLAISAVCVIVLMSVFTKLKRGSGFSI